MGYAMTAPFDRRQFLAATGSAFGALVLSGCRSHPLASADAGGFAGYGPLVPDPAGILDLPPGFSYRVISTLGEAMDDGGTVPDRADGMGCFALAGGEIALVRNHELMPEHDSGGSIATGFDRLSDGRMAAGGTTTLVLDAATLAVRRQFRSLGGTVRNCAGGTTPWNSWLTCEEFVGRAGDKSGVTRDHGWVFEVPAGAPGLVDAVPLTAMGRFNHEAACVDPATGYVYQTEDRPDGVVYRFIPRTPGRLADGGRLQAMVVDGLGDTRNWDSPAMTVGGRHAARWIDLDDVEALMDDLRLRAAAAGAALFARGEGMHMGEGELYFCATNGGARKLGQIFRLVPGHGGRADMLELFFESEREDQFNYGDNLAAGPGGHLIVCEDQYTDTVDNHIRGITPQGRPYALARLHLQTELAGACFSPDGRTMFVNAYSPTRTLAITGPWAGSRRL